MTDRDREPRRGDRGQLSTKVLSPRLLTSRISGHVDLALARDLLAQLDAWLLLGGQDLVALHDCEAVVDYDSDARAAITKWSIAHRGRFRAVHVLVRSRLVAWGLQIVNTIIGKLMTIHERREAFEAALRSVSVETGTSAK